MTRPAWILLLFFASSVANAACPSNAELSWTPTEVFTGDEVTFRMVDYLAAFSGGIATLDDQQRIIIRTISNSNFAVTVPISVARATFTADLPPGNYPVVWRHLWIYGFSPPPECPEVRDVLVVRGTAGPPPQPVPGVSTLALLVLAGLVLAASAFRLRRTQQRRARSIS